jgi:retinol dehydrogenase-12
LFTKELSKRLEAKGSNVYINCCHPGGVRSELSRHMFSPKSFAERIYNLILIPAEDGAVTQMYLATSPEVEEKNIKAQYYVPYATLDKPRGVAAQDDAPLQLWDFTEKLLKEKVPGYEGATI